MSLPDLTNPGQLLGTVTLARERVEVPEWGVAVWVWELTGEQLDAYRTHALRQQGSKVRVDLARLRAGTARLLTYAIRTKDGDPVFDEHDGPDRLLKMGAAGLARVAKVANRLSRLDEEDEDTAEGNSAAARGGSSNGTSPSPSDELALNSSAA